MTITTPINYALLLEAADRFLKVAQTFETSADPMKKALDASIGKQVQKLITDAFQTTVSSAEVHINFTPGPPATATFNVYANGADEDKQKLITNLNALSQVAAKIMAKYQKTPMDWRYVSYER